MSIVVKGLAYAHPNGNQVFQPLSLAVAPGQKAALVGPNGAGKSTLLRLLAGELAPGAGAISRAENPYFVPQHLGQYDGLSLAQALGVAGKLRALHAILAGDAAEQHFAALADDWEIEERVAAALAGWGLPAADLAQPLHTLSGGEKTKVLLAGIEVHAPGLVLLDEPSNHLDTAGRARLYELVERSRATLLVVSHDRALLSRLNLTLELGPEGVTSYGGSYDFYLSQREGQLQAWQAQLEEKEKAQRQARQKARELTEQRHKQEARGRGQKIKQGVPRIVLGALKSQAEQSTAQLRETQQARLHDLGQEVQQLRQQIREQTPLRLRIEASALHPGKILVDARGLNFGYGPQALWPGGLTFQLRAGERLRLSGANGSGKTTLLRLLTGALAPTAGTLTRADFRHVYLDQEYSALDGRLTVFEQVQARNARQLLEHELKTLLHYHQLGPAQWAQPSAQLSGGEKLKLLLCCLAVAEHAPDLLILDEPTNNLDRSSQQVLTQAVQAFAGAMLLISHDEHFVAEVGVTRTLPLGGPGAGTDL